MLRKTRIRSLVAISALTGATVLGGAGLAGATNGTETEVDDTTIAEQEVLLSEATTEMSTGEAETLELPEAPELPEQADDRARQALADRGPDGRTGGDDAVEDDVTDESANETADAPAETAEDQREAPPADTHGATVSETAREGEPGPGHGQAVSETARSHGEAQRDANRPDEGGADDEQELDDDDDEL